MSSLRRQTRTLVSLFVSTLLMAGMLALPAQATDPSAGVLVFSGGEAVIGVEEIDDKDKNTCSKDDDNGLNAPVTTDPLKVPAAQKKRCYNFQAGDGKPGDCVWLAVDPLDTPVSCNIIAHGNVYGWCGSSIGFNGWGEVNFKDTELHLKNITWRLSAGGTLVIDGDVAKSNKVQSQDFSQFFVGLVQARAFDNDTPNSVLQACLWENGADSFQVDGVAAVFPQVI